MQTADIVYQVEQIREIETLAQQRFDVKSITLMRRAGQVAFEYLLKLWPSAKHIAVVCGTGNNGGDGYVLAHVAHNHGIKVDVWQLGDTQKIKNEALQAFEECKGAGVSIKNFYDLGNFNNVDVVVDAILGIGLKGDLSKEARLAIETINFSKLPVLSIDVPSGLDADTGQVLGIAVNATATVTFLGKKLGLLTGAGSSHTGHLYVDNLELPEELYSLIPHKIEKLHLNCFAKYLKPRRRDLNKGEAGHVLVVGGCEGFTGAARMAAEGALRVGAGLVTVATSPKHAEYFNLTRPEIMCRGVHSAGDLAPLLKKATVVVIGPGMGQEAWSKMLLKTVMASELPLVVDADALNLIALKPFSRKNWILTPHPGEAARLLDTTAAKVQENRLDALLKLQQKYDGVCVLKGSGTLILGTHHFPALCDAGNPGMASGGMGDVLSGVIGGLLAQGMPLIDAAKLGVCVHAMAGDKAAHEGGERGMLAMDLMPHLRKLVNVDFKLN